MHFSPSYVLAMVAAVPVVLAKPVQYATTTITSVSPVVTTVTTIISTYITETGVQTFIPGTLTMTFDIVPASLYLSTKTLSTSYTTIYSKSKVKLATSTTTSAATATPTVTTPGTPYACGQQGTATQNMIGLNPPRENDNFSFSDCKTYCLATTACQSFSYQPSTLICLFYAAGIDINPSTTSGMYFESKYTQDSC